MEALYRAYKDRGFAVLAVSLDFFGPDRVKKFAMEKGLTYPIVMDTDKKVAKAYGLKGPPLTYLIDQSGRMVATYWAPPVGPTGALSRLWSTTSIQTASQPNKCFCMLTMFQREDWRMAKKNNKKGRHFREKSDVPGAGTKSVSTLSMVFTSLCCLGPLVLLALGLGSATLTAGLVKNKWLFMGIGAGSLCLSYYLYFRERRCCAATGCTVIGSKGKKALMGIATGLVIFFMVFSLYPYSADSSNSTTGANHKLTAVGELSTVIYFWEPCPTCTVTNPAVKKLQKKYRGQANFRWVNLISDDDAYPLARKYDVQAIPWLVFTDREGAAESLLKGWFTFHQAERRLSALISNGTEAR